MPAEPPRKMTDAQITAELAKLNKEIEDRITRCRSLADERLRRTDPPRHAKYMASR